MKYSGWSPQGRVLSLPKWQIAVLFAVAISLGIAIAVVATGVFLISLPIAAIAVLAYRLFGKGRRRRVPPHVIEGDYEVVEPARPRHGPGRR
jgi:hypothetical protein